MALAMSKEEYINKSVEKKMAEFSKWSFEDQENRCLKNLEKIKNSWSQSSNQADDILKKYPNLSIEDKKKVIDSLKRELVRPEFEKTAEWIDWLKKWREKRAEILAEEQKAKEKADQDCESLLAQIENLPTNEIIIW